MNDRRRILVAVEGGIARVPFEEEQGVEAVIVDWDVAEEGTADDIAEMIRDVESLPATYPADDKAGILVSLREYLERAQEAEDA
jgi:hypothetical protein